MLLLLNYRKLALRFVIDLSLQILWIDWRFLCAAELIDSVLVKGS